MGLWFCGLVLTGMAMVAAEPEGVADLQPAVKAAKLAQLGNLPPAPAGFGWEPYKNAVVLRPKGWHENAMTGPGKVPMHVYACSPTPFTATKPFETGFTLQILEQPRKRAGFGAYAAAEAYLKPFREAHSAPGQTLYTSNAMKGEVMAIWYRYRDAPAGQKPIIVHKFLMASEQWDSVHVFTFEAPEATFEADWQAYGNPIFKMPIVVFQMPITAP